MHKNREKKATYTVLPPPLETQGHYHIRMVLHFLTATTREGLVMSDSLDIRALSGLVQSAKDDWTFAQFFPDDDLLNYLDEKGSPLKGGRHTEWLVSHELPNGSTSDIEKYLANRIRRYFREVTLYNAANKLYEMLDGDFMASYEHQFSITKSVAIMSARTELAQMLDKKPRKR